MNKNKHKQILVISSVPPKPDGIGVELRAWTHLEALASVAEIELILAMTPQQLAQSVQLEKIYPLCKRVSIIKLLPWEKKIYRLVPGLTALVRVADIFKPSFRSIAFDASEQSEYLQNLHFDIAFCFRIRSYEVYEHLTKTLNCQANCLFVDFDDIESLSGRRELPFIRKTIGLESTLIAYSEILRIRILEHRIRREADMISICSEIDRQRVISQGCSARVAVVPNSYPQMPALPLRPITSVAKLLFVGTMSYPPNEDAVLFFCKNIYPRIRKAYHGDIQLKIVGRRPSEKLIALSGNDSIFVTGGVDSIEPFYDEADLVVVPIRFGGGTRIKILEALSYGRAVVSTTIGAEGLELKQGRDISIADDAQEFAHACIELLENQSARFKLAQSGRQQVTAIYDRKQIQHALVKTVLALQTREIFPR